jgi:hypothetical protein
MSDTEPIDQPVFGHFESSLLLTQSVKLLITHRMRYQSRRLERAAD